MAGLETVLWASAIGLVGLQGAAEIGLFAIPAPLDQLVEAPIDIALVGVALVGVLFA